MISSLASEEAVQEQVAVDHKVAEEAFLPSQVSHSCQVDQEVLVDSLVEVHNQVVENKDNDELNAIQM